MSGLLRQAHFLCATAVVILALFAPRPAGAWTYHLLYSFCAKPNCADGQYSGYPIVVDQAGNLYGSTNSGVFELRRSNGDWRERLIYSFPPPGSSGQTGATGLIIDKSGNLYGTTPIGAPAGSYQTGSVFEITKHRSQWSSRVLYPFCQDTYCLDGDIPEGISYAGADRGLPYDGHSPLFGATEYGGAYGGGVVFELRRNRGGWHERVIYSFCAQANCGDGENPYSGVTVAPSGVLYGTTVVGGNANNDGVLYQLSPGEAATWSQQVLYSFCSLPNCADGAEPSAAPALDSSGGLFGTTPYGGTRCDSNGDPCGVAFALRPKRGGATLHSFCSLGTCKSGTQPSAGLIRDPAGNLFGTTYSGGAYGTAGGGTVFEISGGKFRVLYSFCADQSGCSDGDQPGPLVMDASGDLYGTTIQGGANHSGVVFELTP